MITKVSKLTGDIKIRGSLDCSDHELMDFVVLRDMDQCLHQFSVGKKEVDFFSYEHWPSRDTMQCHAAQSQLK
ncbi:hypothetical protein WISP_62312 [Willisornis vidua]|uniref:Uncharacterized protein n=1 Tax=Willisornis vidua TaxID=1566151 RepID=A0ABQ9DG24_9PASS|nr:hypothetical protein WISP_62312 [Willisornis vidua]